MAYYDLDNFDEDPRDNPGQCPQCGYDLEYDHSGYFIECDECGFKKESE